MRPTWLFYAGIGLECAIEFFAIMFGALSPDVHNLIGGAIARLAIVLLLAFYAMRGSGPARIVLVALEAITSVGGVGAAVVFATTGTCGLLKALAGGLAIAIVYGAIAIAIFKGVRHDRDIAALSA